MELEHTSGIEIPKCLLNCGSSVCVFIYVYMHIYKSMSVCIYVVRK